jgi:biopolymer transport protein ExbD
MSWKVRHEGSPQAVEGLSAEQVLEGLQDGVWEPTDEVMGPGETEWTALENHPQFAEAAAEIEPPPPRHVEDEAKIDMNPLIDVVLVLLVFFILTTTYAALQARLDTPRLHVGEEVKVVTDKQVEESMILVTIGMEDGKPVTKVQGQTVHPDNLKAELRRYVRQTQHTILMLKTERNVPFGAVAQVQSAAAGAGVTKLLRATGAAPAAP